MNRDASRLLLVEEDRLLTEITLFRMELLGFEVQTATSGDAALDLVGRESFDAIIIDLVLPDMEGIELINRLSNEPATSEIPIMAFSIESDLTTVQRAHAAGAQEYLVLPYDPFVLEEKLDRLLEERTAVITQHTK